MGFPDDDATVNAGARHAEGAHRPLLAALFANETWGGRFDWLAFGAVDAAAAARFLAARDAALTGSSARRAPARSAAATGPRTRSRAAPPTRPRAPSTSPRASPTSPSR